MKLQPWLTIVLATVLATLPATAAADTLAMPSGEEMSIDGDELKDGATNPYIVKKGDTLWDIADHFFKDPMKWVRIWEKNLYITNPDLIYPGNEIWLDGEQKRGEKRVTMRVVRPKPHVRAKPVERLEKPIDPRLLLTAIRRQDFIDVEAVEGVGHILDSRDERINYGANDLLYLRMDEPADVGDTFDIFRTGDPVRNPETGETVGVLINHLGQIEITSETDGIYRGVVLTAFEEISRGDRLKPAKDVDSQITPVYPGGDLAGQILYIRNDAAEAGQNQVVGISLGRVDGLDTGTVMSVHQAGRSVRDTVTGKAVRLPEEKIGELIVLVAQENASIALVTESTSPINLGDTVRNRAAR